MDDLIWLTVGQEIPDNALAEVVNSIAQGDYSSERGLSLLQRFRTQKPRPPFEEQFGDILPSLHPRAASTSLEADNGGVGWRRSDVLNSSDFWHRLDAHGSSAAGLPVELIAGTASASNLESPPGWRELVSAAQAANAHFRVYGESARDAAALRWRSLALTGELSFAEVACLEAAMASGTLPVNQNGRLRDVSRAWPGGISVLLDAELTLSGARASAFVTVVSAGTHIAEVGIECDGLYVPAEWAGRQLLKSHHIASLEPISTGPHELTVLLDGTRAWSTIIRVERN